uniref:Uncharacterized protein n=1 Tax=Helicotheca tamesis TaxID=374047 RepID=A0A7S2MWY0_9STRA
MQTTSPSLFVTNTIHYHSFASTSKLRTIAVLSGFKKCVICKLGLFSGNNEKTSSSWLSGARKKSNQGKNGNGRRRGDTSGGIVKCVACGAYAHRTCCFYEQQEMKKETGSHIEICPVNSLRLPSDWIQIMKQQQLTLTNNDDQMEKIDEHCTSSKSHDDDDDSVVVATPISSPSNSPQHWAMMCDDDCNTPKKNDVSTSPSFCLIPRKHCFSGSSSSSSSSSSSTSFES